MRCGLARQAMHAQASNRSRWAGQSPRSFWREACLVALQVRVATLWHRTLLGSSSRRRALTKMIGERQLRVHKRSPLGCRGSLCGREAAARRNREEPALGAAQRVRRQLGAARAALHRHGPLGKPGAQPTAGPPGRRRGCRSGLISRPSPTPSRMAFSWTSCGSCTRSCPTAASASSRARQAPQLPGLLGGLGVSRSGPDPGSCRHRQEPQPPVQCAAVGRGPPQLPASAGVR